MVWQQQIETDCYLLGQALQSVGSEETSGVSPWQLALAWTRYPASFLRNSLELLRYPGVDLRFHQIQWQCTFLQNPVMKRPNIKPVTQLFLRPLT